MTTQSGTATLGSATTAVASTSATDALTTMPITLIRANERTTSRSRTPTLSRTATQTAETVTIDDKVTVATTAGAACIGGGGVPPTKARNTRTARQTSSICKAMLKASFWRGCLRKPISEIAPPTTRATTKPQVGQVS